MIMILMCLQSMRPQAASSRVPLVRVKLKPFFQGRVSWLVTHSGSTCSHEAPVIVICPGR